MAVNYSTLRWTMHEGNKYGVDLWFWLKVRYDIMDKLDSLRRLYGEKIRSLKLNFGGLFDNYIKQFQGLAILWREINANVDP